VPFCGKNRLFFVLFCGAKRGTMPRLAAPPVPTSALLKLVLASEVSDAVSSCPHR
jgi:hypothetical protein